MRTVSKLVVAVAVSVAVPSAAAAQWDIFTPLTRYTLSGCWEGVSCHTMTFTVARVTPVLNPEGRPTGVPGGWQPGDHSVGWLHTHTSFEVPGTITVTGPLRSPYPYAWGSMGIKANSWGQNEFFWSNCLGSLYFRDAGFTCSDGMNPYQSIGGTVRDGWAPTDLTFHVFRSDKPGMMCPTYVGTCPDGWALATDSARVTLRLTNTEDLRVATTPEPGTYALLATGLALLAVPALRRRRG